MSEGTGFGRALPPGLATCGVLVITLTIVLVGLMPTGGSSYSRESPFSRASSQRVIAATSPVSLSLVSSPTTICAWEQLNCPGGADTTTVTMRAVAAGSGIAAWPAVQLLFLVETTPYDGVFEGCTEAHCGAMLDPCATTNYTVNINKPLCDESNGVPFFLANVGGITQAIQNQYRSTRFSYGMADYGATCDHYDDCNGIHSVYGRDGTHAAYTINTTGWDSATYSAYHVDVGDFVSGASFAAAVDSTFLRSVLGGNLYLPGSNLSDNFLHASSITALYGSLAGAGLNWSPSAHHVIVVIGSTAPRDPAYIQNYCVSDSIWAAADDSNNGPNAWPPPVCVSNDTNVTSSVCEPSYQFNSSLASPECVGWVNPSTVSPNTSIAEMARDSPNCRDSLGGSCTVDMIDLYAMTTNPNSPGWVSSHFAWDSTISNGSTAGSWWAVQDAHHVISAGCDLANASGGTWDGPTISNCGQGRTGSLAYVSHGPNDAPILSNPTLLSALATVGLGNPPPGLVALGQIGPMFTFAPYDNFRVDESGPMTATCVSQFTPTSACQIRPTFLTHGGVTYLAWNWSTDPNLDVLYSGDSWTASFLLVATGPPYNQPVPIDVCGMVTCTLAESLAFGAPRSSMTFVPATSSLTFAASESLSFPLAEVTVLTIPGETSSPSLPGPPPPNGVPPPQPIPIGGPISLPSGGVVAAASASGLSLAEVAAGILGAGFARVVIQRRAIATRVAMNVAGRARPSRFDSSVPDDPRFGRFD